MFNLSGLNFWPGDPIELKGSKKNWPSAKCSRRPRKGQTFFADAEAQACDAGLYVLGQAEAPGPYISGEFGAGLKIFEEPRSAARLYHYIPRISPGVVNCVAFSPLNQLPLTRMFWSSWPKPIKPKFYCGP